MNGRRKTTAAVLLMVGTCAFMGCAQFMETATIEKPPPDPCATAHNFGKWHMDEREHQPERVCIQCDGVQTFAALTAMHRENIADNPAYLDPVLAQIDADLMPPLLFHSNEGRNQARGFSVTQGNRALTEYETNVLAHTLRHDAALSEIIKRHVVARMADDAPPVGEYLYPWPSEEPGTLYVYTAHGIRAYNALHMVLNKDPVKERVRTAFASALRVGHIAQPPTS